ncbi:MAG: GAF domain-containing protein [Actinobacteria bacterium]|nr:GAF domain-containing protein [Actinomycetota bacterium]
MKLLKEFLGVFRSRLGLKLSLPLLIAMAALMTPVFFYFHFESSADLSSQGAIAVSEKAVTSISAMDTQSRQEMLDVHEVLIDHYEGRFDNRQIVSDFNAAAAQAEEKRSESYRYAVTASERKQLDRCRSLDNQFKDIFSNQLVPLSAHPGAALDPLENRLDGIFNTMIGIHTELLNSFKTDRDATFQSQSDNRETLETWGFFSAIGGVLLGLLAAGLLTRRLLIPVKNMVKGAQKISRGNLDHRIPAGRGHDEMAVLANSFNNMAASLERQIEQQEQERVRIRSIHQSIGDGIVVVDRGGIIISANPAAEAALGKTALELERSRDTGVAELQEAVNREIQPVEMASCWEEKQCSKAGCPAFHSTDRRCWLQCGTYCNNQIQGTFRQKRDACERCDVFQHNAVCKLEVKIRDRFYSIEIVPVLDNEGQERGRTIVMHDVTELQHANEDLERKRAEQELLNEIGETVSSSLNLDRTLTMVLDKLFESWGADAGGVHIMNHSTGRLEMTASRNISDEERMALETAEKGMGIAWRVYHSGEAVIISDMLDEKNMVKAIVRAGNRAVLGVPLVANDKVVGSMILASTAAGYFSEEDSRLLRLIGNQVGVAVENSILYLESVEHARKALAKNRIITALSSSLDLSTVWDDFLTQAKKLIAFDRISVTTDAQEGMVRLLAQSGDSPEAWTDESTFPAKDSLPGTVMLTGKPYLSGDISRAPVCKRQKQLVAAGYCSQLIIPLFAKGEVIGTLNLASKDRNAFSKDDLDELSPIAAHVALSIANQRLFEDISRAKTEWETTFDSVTDGIVIIGQDRRIKRMNEAAARMLGGRINDFLGERCHKVIHNLCCEPPSCPLYKAVPGDSPSKAEQMTPDGRMLELTVDPMFDAEGNKIGAVHFLRDITESKRLRQQLIQSEKMVAVGQLVSGVAHEINNPLTGVIGYSQLLLSQDIGEKAKKDAEAIYSEAERATKIVRHLLSFARKHAPEQKAVDINNLVLESIELKAYDLKVNNITVETRLKAHLPLTMADPHQLQQVFLNLITNAEQAMLEDQGSGRIVISTGISRGAIRIEFADNGPGVPEELRDRVFDPFFTTKDVGKGTGLGLSICYGIIEEHNGRIWLEPGSGAGAKMAVELPIVQVSEQKLSGAQAPADGLASGKILLVDDEATVRKVLAEAMRKMGHSVDTARDGNVALKMLKRDRYDCVVSDVRMPRMDGPTLLEAIRQMNPELARRFIFISGDSVNPKTQTYLSKLGAPYLVKPFDPSELGKHIQAILGSKGQQRKAS